jgi:ketosteroid isomerase-like protein
MPVDLKPPVSTYFETSNAHEAERMSALFTEDARVHDERQDHRGRAQIRGWAEQTFRDYQMIQTPSEARDEDGATVVRAEVSGTFPGSPIELTFRFVVDGELISELEIS